jgi:hypothetical protein
LIRRPWLVSYYRYPVFWTSILMPPKAPYKLMTCYLQLLSPTRSILTMQPLKSTTLFSLAFALHTSALVLRRDDGEGLCLPEGSLCQVVVNGLLLCCDDTGLSCDPSLVGLLGFVGLVF